ncbi:E3 ubiquitin-protein ligase [Canna indica]|uniref:E3 ubiquitin-protein ligase n=1 Tax=Canna indica TaxID=4628 RepID=A0AAQ3KH01_9LILI|nr:E3 ubiquitin-protein ligase [Canna indica]
MTRGHILAAKAVMANSGSDTAEAEAGPAQMVRVKRELLVMRMTCPICHKLLRDATTISECLHTFCRKCIYEKLTDEEVDCCPVCNIRLGSVPLEKLRPDHNLQDLRVKIFPLRKTKTGVPDSVPITLPVRRKEISLSSLAVSAPRVATQTGLTGRRTKVVSRAATSHGYSPTNVNTKSEDDSFEKFSKKSGSAGNLSKLTSGRKQTLSNSDWSSNAPSKETENPGKPFQDKAELWKPLNCLVEAANRTKSFKSIQQNSVYKADQRDGLDTEVKNIKTRIKVHPHRSKVQDKKNDKIQIHPMAMKARRLKGVNQKRRKHASSVQTLFDAANAKNDRRITPLWFSLVSSFDETGDSSLPQISTSYLRIKDGNVPVSYIQKYLVTKLNLFSEAEVEIMCRGEPVRPEMSLNNFVKQWLQGGTSHRVETIIGASAKEFVIVIGYRRYRMSSQ